MQGALIQPYNQNKKKRRRYQTVDDSEDEDFDPQAEKRNRLAAANSFPPVRDVSQCLEDEALARKLQDQECEVVRPRVQILSESDEEDEVEEENPITITLQKCDRIAASLREELQASSSSDSAVTEDRYAEVDVAAAKIVSQVCLRYFTPSFRLKIIMI